MPGLPLPSRGPWGYSLGTRQMGQIAALRGRLRRILRRAGAHPLFSRGLSLLFGPCRGYDCDGTNSQIASQANRRGGFAYGMAVGLSLLAAGIAWLMNPIVGQSTEPIFFAAVMLAAWVGGLGPGLVATAVSGYLSGYYFFLNPVGSVGFGWDDILRLIIFCLVALLISSLTSLRKRAEAALQRANDQLEVRIEQRTAELRRSNELLLQSEERFRLLVDGVADYALVMLDAAGQIISWNPGADAFSRFSRNLPSGATPRRCTSPKTFPRESPPQICARPFSTIAMRKKDRACAAMASSSGPT